MLVKLVLAAFLAALAVPALAECFEDKTASTTPSPVASTDKPATTPKPAGG